MSEKVRDRKNRWRAITVAFRASAEENELLNRKVYICGITKQRYIIDRLLEDKVRVVVNRKVLNRLSERLEVLNSTIHTALQAGTLDDVSADELKFILNLLKEIQREEGKFK